MNSTKPFAYLAGYIDGDGSFNLQISKKNRSKNGKIYPCTERLCQISITGKQIDCLTYLQKHFGGSILTTKKIPNQSIVYRLCLSIPRANWLSQLLPFLVEKRAQCILAMRFKTSSEDKQLIIEELKEARSRDLAYPAYKEEILPFRKTITPTLYDFQYLAGFIDAECCIMINKRRDKNSMTYTAKLRCGNTKTPPISWMIKRFGGNVFYVSRKHFPHHNDLIDYHLQGKDLLSVLQQCCPFLIHKKNQCINAINLLQLIQRRVNPRSPNFKEWKAFSDPVKEEIYHNIKSLNKKGS